MATEKKDGHHYLISAVVQRSIIDNVTVGVRAKSASAALKKAEKFLEQFPGPSNVEGVDYGYIENRENLSSEVTDLKLQEKD